MTAVLILLSAATCRAETRYVMVGDYVNARAKAGRHSASLGRLETGDEVNVTGKKKNGFAQVDDLSLEENEGWVHAGYLVEEKPVRVGTVYRVCSKGRVKARRWIDGPRCAWLYNGARVTVLWEADGWSVTNRGYVQSRFLEEDP